MSQWSDNASGENVNVDTVVETDGEVAFVCIEVVGAEATWELICEDDVQAQRFFDDVAAAKVDWDGRPRP